MLNAEFDKSAQMPNAPILNFYNIEHPNLECVRIWKGVLPILLGPWFRPYGGP
jgi:hypothetical protein